MYAKLFRIVFFTAVAAAAIARAKRCEWCTRRIIFIRRLQIYVKVKSAQKAKNKNAKKEHIIKMSIIISVASQNTEHVIERNEQSQYDNGCEFI